RHSDRQTVVPPRGRRVTTPIGRLFPRKLESTFLSWVLAFAGTNGEGCLPRRGEHRGELFAAQVVEPQQLFEIPLPLGRAALLGGLELRAQIRALLLTPEHHQSAAERQLRALVAAKPRSDIGAD